MEHGRTQPFLAARGRQGCVCWNKQLGWSRWPPAHIPAWPWGQWAPRVGPAVWDSPSACLSAQAQLTLLSTCPSFLLSSQVCFLHLGFSCFYLSRSKLAVWVIWFVPCGLFALWSLVLHCFFSNWEVFDTIHYTGLAQQS